MPARSQHCHCLTFPPPSIPLTILSSWKDLIGYYWFRKARNRFKSYLTERCQKIKLGDCLCSKADLTFGDPQGSVLGPLLFTLYATSLNKLSLDMLSLTTSTLLTASCMCPLHQVTPVQPWMVYNCAWTLSSHGCRQINRNWAQKKLNSSLSRTNGSRANISLCFLLRFLVSKLTQQNLLGILGIIFDKNFTCRWHTPAVTSSCFYHIRNLLCIRRYLDRDSAILFANALVSSRLHYGNSLLSEIADTDLTKLQRVQNRLARIVTKSLPNTRSLLLLRSFHWLPVTV